MVDGFSVTFRTEEQKKAYKELCEYLRSIDVKPRDYFRKHVVAKAKRIKGGK